jgi:molybdopterin-containing oxidoreductase family molybdopterin binding subunit
MLQTGERGSDNWEQITWDEAFSLIAEKFSAAIDEYGPSSVALWNGSPLHGAYLSGATYQMFDVPIYSNGVGFTRFLQKTGATLLSTGDDEQGIYFRWNLLSIPENSSEDLQNSKMIVLWGSNPVDAGNTKASWHYICKARENGAKLVVIDPLFTAPAAHADLWIPIRVGTDAALMCAMSNYIIDNALYDESYLKSGSVAPLLLKEDGTYLRLSDMGLEVSEEEDQPVVWDEAAQDFVAHTEAGDPALSGARDANGTNVRTVYDLALENIRPFTVEYAAHECGIPAEQIEELARLSATVKPTYFCIDWGPEHTYTSWRIYFASPFLAALTGNVGLSGAGYAAPQAPASTIEIAPIATNKEALNMDDAKPNKLIPGEYLIEIMDTGKWAGEDYPIRCVYIQGHNPLDNGCAPLEMIEAWSKIDFVVTAEQFMTTSAYNCDLVLPVTMTWEMEEWVGWMNQKAIEPVGEGRTDMQIWRGIAAAMGYDDLYPKTDEEYLRELLDTPENLEAGLGYDDWHEAGIMLGEYKYAETVLPEYNRLGRTEFYIEHMRPRSDFGQVFSVQERLPSYEHSAEAYADNPLRDTYPLFGFSSHDNYHGQSLHAHNAWLDEFRTVDGKPFCRIHEDAAKTRGISTGDTVRVYNDHGSCVLKALVTKGIQAESVWVPHGFNWDEFDEGFAQSLTGHYPDLPSAGVNFNDWLCEVEKYEGGAQ